MKSIQEEVAKNAKSAKETFNEIKEGFNGRFADLAVSQFVMYGWEIADDYISASGDEGFNNTLENLAQTMSNGGRRFSTGGDRDFVAYSIQRAYRLVLSGLFKVWLDHKGEHHPLHKIYDKAGLLR